MILNVFVSGITTFTLTLVAAEWVQHSQSATRPESVPRGMFTRKWRSRWARSCCGRDGYCAQQCCVARVPRWAVPGVFAVDEWIGAMNAAQASTTASPRTSTGSFRSPLMPHHSSEDVSTSRIPHEEGTLLRPGGVNIVLCEWAWAGVLILGCLASGLQLLVAAGGKVWEFAVGNVHFASVILELISVTTQQGGANLAVQIMWGAACLYVARQVQALKLLMLDSRLPVPERCDRVRAATTRLVAIMESWSWTLGTVVLAVTGMDALLVLTYAVGLVLPDSALLSTEQSGRLATRGFFILLAVKCAVEALCLMLYAVLVNAEVGSLQGAALRLLPSMEAWEWTPTSEGGLWADPVTLRRRRVQAAAQASQVEAKEEERLDAAAVSDLRWHLYQLTGVEGGPSMFVTLGGVIITGPLLAQVFTLGTSAYYAILAYVGVSGSF